MFTSRCNLSQESLEKFSYKSLNDAHKSLLNNLIISLLPTASQSLNITTRYCFDFIFMAIKMSDYSASNAQLCRLAVCFFDGARKIVSIKVTFNFGFEIRDTVSFCHWDFMIFFAVDQRLEKVHQLRQRKKILCGALTVSL